jgi:Tfp pilus assembly protein PilX
VIAATLPAQRGAALVVVLVLLLLVGWFALSAFLVSGQHLQIVGNSQVRAQAAAAAQRAIEQTISSNLFTQDPAAVAAAPISTDVDGDGVVDFTATLTPQPKCIRIRPIKTSELNIADPKDRVCLQSSGAGGSMLIDRSGAPVAAGDSMCSNSEWNVAAAVTDVASGSSVAVNQGVAIRVAAIDGATFCK